MIPTLIIYTDEESTGWFYKDEEGTFGPFDTAHDLFTELKKLGKVIDGYCPTCQGE